MRTVAVLAIACLYAGEAPAARFTVDASPAAIPGATWEPRERIALLAPRLWSMAGVSWQTVLGNALEETLPKTAFQWRIHECADGPALTYQLGTLLPAWEPTVVILMPGISSTLYPSNPELPIETLAQHLQAGIESIRATGAEVVVATPPRLSEPPDAKIEARLDACAQQIRQVATITGTTLWDARQALADATANGPLHEKERNRLMADGHALLANGAAAALGQALSQAPFTLATDEPLFADQVDFGIHLRRCRDPKQVEIRYTTDGKEPGPTSKLYEKPFRLTQTTNLQIFASTKDGKVRRNLRMQVFKDAFRPADRPSKPTSGLRWAWYPLPAKPTSLPDFTALTPTAEGICEMFDLDLQARHPDVAQMRRDFGVVWRGFLDVPADGVYLFWLRADDGARLTIGDERVITHDVPHPADSWGEGRITLRKGMHAFTLDYFQSSGTQAVALEYGSRTLRRQPVPQVALAYDAAEKPKPKPKDAAKKDRPK
jgi:hypothetical protein